jgi:integrase
MQSGSIYQERSGAWLARYRDVTGKRRAKGGFKYKREAAAWLAERLAEVRLGRLYRPDLTYDELCDKFLAQYDVQPATRERMTHMLKKSRSVFGAVSLTAIRPEDIAVWRRTLREGTRWDATKAMRQVLERAVTWRYLVENPARLVKNPQPVTKEVQPFEAWDEVMAVADELSDRYRAIPILGVGTGLRPGEWIALQVGDIDWEARTLTVRRAYDSNDRRVKEIKTKTRGRLVPLRSRVLEALDDLRGRPARSLVFPSSTGGFLDLHNWRNREWNTSVEAAGIEHRTPYAMRHTYAAWALRAGMNTFSLARRMGTSLEMIEKTYGHLTLDAVDHELELLDTWDGCA